MVFQLLLLQISKFRNKPLVPDTLSKRVLQGCALQMCTLDCTSSTDKYEQELMLRGAWPLALNSVS